MTARLSDISREEIEKLAENAVNINRVKTFYIISQKQWFEKNGKKKFRWTN